METTRRLALTIADQGADLLELGIPFSDPLADGPTIQAASVRALRHEVHLEDVLKFAGKLRQIPGATDVVIQQTMHTPTLMVEANRTFGLSVNRTQKERASNLLMTTAGSQQIDQVYWLDPKTGMSYLINVYTPQAQVNSVNSLKTIPVESSSDASDNHDVQLLGNLTDLSAEGTPGGITHANIMPLFDIYVGTEGRDLGGVLADVETVAKSMEHELPRSAAIEIHGQASLMHDAYFELIFGLLAAIVLVYLLIVVNFQSWLDPFIIIPALPGALTGIAWALFLTHTRLSEPALTGAIMTIRPVGYRRRYPGDSDGLVRQIASRLHSKSAFNPTALYFDHGYQR